MAAFVVADYQCLMPSSVLRPRRARERRKVEDCRRAAFGRDRTEADVGRSSEFREWGTLLARGRVVQVEPLGVVSNPRIDTVDSTRF